MNVPFAVAAALSLGVWAIHVFLGGPEIAKPLLASDLEPVPKYASYYCWHIVTAVLFAMAVGYGYAAWVPAGHDVAVVMTALVGFCTVWSVGLVAWAKRSPLELPQWGMFGVVLVAAGVGHLA